MASALRYRLAIEAGLVGAAFLGGLALRPAPVESVRIVERDKAKDSKSAASRDLKITQVIPPKVVIRRTIKAPDGTVTTDEREETGGGSKVIQEAARQAAESSVREVTRVSDVVRGARPDWGVSVSGNAGLLGPQRSYGYGIQIHRRLLGASYLGLGVTKQAGSYGVGVSLGVLF